MKSWDKGERVRQNITYFNFRLNIGVSNLNHVNEFVFKTKILKGGEKKIPVYPVKSPEKVWKDNCKEFVNCI